MSRTSVTARQLEAHRELARQGVSSTMIVPVKDTLFTIMGEAANKEASPIVLDEEFSVKVFAKDALQDLGRVVRTSLDETYLTYYRVSPGYEIRAGGKIPATVYSKQPSTDSSDVIADHVENVLQKADAMLINRSEYHFREMVGMGNPDEWDDVQLRLNVISDVRKKLNALAIDENGRTLFRCHAPFYRVETRTGLVGPNNDDVEHRIKLKIDDKGFLPRWSELAVRFEHTEADLARTLIEFIRGTVPSHRQNKYQGADEIIEFSETVELPSRNFTENLVKHLFWDLGKIEFADKNIKLLSAKVAGPFGDRVKLTPKLLNMMEEIEGLLKKVPAEKLNEHYMRAGWALPFSPISLIKMRVEQKMGLGNSLETSAGPAFR